ncbi:tRNA (guanine-N(7)-)-methyltransferase non-catalytic subunit TRM82 [Vanrija pseudolonga]|uniref:tRNA (Guanine-N(7)-)-methyltransferase non-catalytic subunit TRM82 n=1 Tax=Vanrija pseudolonga TaxID=143232 RepID=A0AAF0Y366_9TREE|nr:tRNA (guanine-N(7)-)-methyltransferase non-catalytic subunit TRM82 [Vanrija pseudolonga]
MATLPFPPSAVASTSRHLVVASGSTLHLVSSDNAVVNAAPDAEAATTKTNTSGLVRRLAISPDNTVVVSAGDDKTLRVWDIEGGLKLRSTRNMIKRVADLSFDHDGAILVTDKVGDVFRYPVEPRDVDKRPQGFSLTSDPSLNPDADYLLGHVSVVSQHALTPDGKHLITADRDEHIRVSRYPLTYVIDRYLFGSEGFVSAIHVPAGHPTLLVSGGGEPTLQIWDWAAGKLLSRVDVLASVLPARRYRPATRRVKTKRNQPPKAAPAGPAPSDDPTNEGWYVAPEGSMYPVGNGVVVDRITSVVVDGVTVVVFNVEGGAALHSFVLPTEASAASPEVSSVTFAHPVLGLTPVPGTPSSLLVALDSTFGVQKGDAELDQARAGQSFAVVAAAADGKLSDVSAEHQPLLSALTQSLAASESLAATPAALSQLALYPNLGLFPRWPGFEEDEELAGTAEDGVAAGGDDKEKLNTRQLGRMKARGADVQDLIPKKNKKRKKSGKGGAAAGGGGGGGGGAEDGGEEEEVNVAFA